MVITDSDPYEIRDRGYLLQNLKCDELAIKDFETFIEECPDDPSIEVLQSQIEEMDMPERLFTRRIQRDVKFFYVVLALLVILLGTV